MGKGKSLKSAHAQKQKLKQSNNSWIVEEKMSQIFHLTFFQTTLTIVVRQKMQPHRIYTQCTVITILTTEARKTLRRASSSLNYLCSTFYQKNLATAQFLLDDQRSPSSHEAQPSSTRPQGEPKLKNQTKDREVLECPHLGSSLIMTDFRN